MGVLPGAAGGQLASGGKRVGERALDGGGAAAALAEEPHQVGGRALQAPRSTWSHLHCCAPRKPMRSAL